MYSFCVCCVIQGDDLETPRGFPSGASTQPMGIIHHMERWETGTKALSKSDTDQSEEGILPSIELWSFCFCIQISSLRLLVKMQVKAFCDVDQNKIQKGFYTYEESKVKDNNKYHEIWLELQFTIQYLSHIKKQRNRTFQVFMLTGFSIFPLC